jgi:hypothetical protein
MIAFITTSVPTLDKIRVHTWNVGRLFTPRMATGMTTTLASGYPWAADCDGFGGFHPRRYLKMLSNLPSDSGCRFVVIPDKIGDAKETLSLFMRWQPIVKELDLPVAYVLQDGLESVGVPWDLTDVVFVGGTTEFKLGSVARKAVESAKERGKWAHMGRVNTAKRALYAREIGCDSFDGSSWGRFPDTFLDDLIAILEPERSSPVPS